mmetsp:Transcript_2442/g.4827  ORF Transcript_2442/g.4827 Transcript_2442/m.4827 type:complete len:466 (+) Transcript_2442:103-1500(+)
MAYNADATFLPSWGSGMKPPKSAGQDSVPSSADNLKETHSTTDGFGCCKKPSKKTRAVGNFPPKQQGSLYGTGYGTGGSLGPMKPRKIWVVDDGALTGAMLLLPFLAFFVIAYTFLIYWRHGWMAHLAIVLIVGCSVGCFYIGGVKAKGLYEDNKVTDQFLVFLSCFVFILAVLGVVVGYLGFESYTKPYHIAINSRYYENVMPSENPKAKMDASMIQFAPGARVDTTKALGYRDGTLYCVAPIIGVNTERFVGYWAAGVNCCGSRGDFRCDEVSDFSVHGGLIVPPIKQYMAGAAQAASQYDLSIPDEPVFIKWTSDPNKAVESIMSNSRSFTWTSVLLVGVLCLVVVMIINVIHGKKKNGIIDRLYSIGPNEEGSHKPDPFGKLDVEATMLQPMTSAKKDPLLPEEANQTKISEPASTLPATSQMMQNTEAYLPQGGFNLKQDPFMTTNPLPGSGDSVGTAFS